MSKRSRGKGVSRDGLYLTLSCIGVLVGIGVGLALHYTKPSKVVFLWIGLPGELLMRMLEAAAIPLAVCSVISNVCKVKYERCLCRVWITALLYITITNLIGATIGAVLAVIIRPGSGVTNAVVYEPSDVIRSSDIFADLIRNFVPGNIVSAFFEKSQTQYKTVVVTVPDNGNNITTNGSDNTRKEIQSSLGTSGGTNLLGLVIAGSALGFAAAKTGDAVRPFLTFFASFTDVIMRLVQLFLLLAPLGYASLIAVAIGGAGDPEDYFQEMKIFLAAFITGILLLFFLVLPLTYFIFVRRNPLYFIAGAARPFLIALVTRSSARCLPEVMHCAEKRFDVDERVSRSVAPFTVNINRDGCIMWLALTTVYMTQVQDDVTAGRVIIIILLSALGPLLGYGTGGTLLLMSAILDIPLANWTLVLALEWFCDRVRTTINVLSHLMCCVVTWHVCKGKLTSSSYDLTSQNSETLEYDMTEKGKAVNLVV